MEEVVCVVIFIIILMNNLYSFKRNGKKRSFNVKCILEWNGIIDKITFWDIRECLVFVFKQKFSVFKQYYTYFHIFFHPHIFLQIFLNNNFQFLNTHIKPALNIKIFRICECSINWLSCSSSHQVRTAFCLKKFKQSFVSHSWKLVTTEVPCPPPSI